MKTAIIYYSKHHGNTKKLLDAIAALDSEVELIDAAEKQESDLGRYDRVGFASGIYYGKFAEQVLSFAKGNLPAEKDVFFIATAGSPAKSRFNSIAKVAESRNCKELGRYICKGFDTFGPFKLVGGLHKGHPTDDEIRAAVDFYKAL